MDADEPSQQGSAPRGRGRGRGDRPGAQEAARALAERATAFRALLWERLRITGVSKRALSLAMRKDEAYIQQLLEARPDRVRALPTPDELRLGAPLLGVSLVELLRVAYGVTPEELAAELGTLAAHSGALGAEAADLTPDQLEEVRAFVAFVKARARYRGEIRAETVRYAAEDASS